MPNHLYGLGIDCVGYNAAILSHVFDKFIESRSLDLLPLEITQRVSNEVKQCHALPKLLYKQRFSL